MTWRILFFLVGFAGSAWAVEATSPPPESKTVTFTVTVEEAKIIAEAVYGNWPPTKVALPLLQKLKSQIQPTETSENK